MLDINYIEANFDEVAKRLNTRNGNYTDDLKKCVDLNLKRKSIIMDVEKLKSDKNSLSKEIGSLVRDKKIAEADEIKKRVSEMNEAISKYDEELKETSSELDNLLHYIPNLPDADIKVGTDDSENEEMRRWGDEFKKTQEVPHWDIATKLGLVNFELGPKLSGSRFVVYTNRGSKMVRALADILLTRHTNNGYEEFGLPVIVNADIMYGTGQLPKFADDAYKTTDGQYLIPTAEVPLTNIHDGEILNVSELPKKYTAYTQCFRQEAGSAGRDTKGLIRLHQFNKVEMVRIVEAKTSDQALLELTNDAEEILKMFNLPYRVVELCTGDLGFSAARTYDLEVWFPSQQKYREISSCSNTRDFQARNMMLRTRDADGNIQYANTLNGSGVAIDRLVAAILENYWDGEKLILPEVLQPYFNNEKYLK
ncbi:serine--tRNA ligase [Mesoplasma lactucae]|uniref:Serine--tRNA ligase n=1 Tax=Mesoplasma lactucae ATCC 49193 TaxID=81460 RepID=A0A291ISD0_9MOLU|nr:serine--tRNA ligase [Mesoplasma lactucae]ATG97699.1 serine--tRNA ligase [Mesoplasma lactucae ATCC 49193]ATZ19835.1 seryl-tRNA synthetase [Mesoplasma lactucae ATCC 49193]MCL8216698.1 Serine--tRNA ligase [Mesoplasma lactucae ATCC 49193]